MRATQGRSLRGQRHATTATKENSTPGTDRRAKISRIPPPPALRPLETSCGKNQLAVFDSPAALRNHGNRAAKKSEAQARCRSEHRPPPSRNFANHRSQKLSWGQIARSVWNRSMQPNERAL